MDKKSNSKVIIFLNILLMVYSLSGVCSKMAAGEKLLSGRFCMFYAFIILLLGLYAIGWQQIIKRMPLTLAYSNRAVTVVWGMIWGLVFFGEKITPGKVIGAALVIAGVVLYSKADQEAEK